jgi:hypothetical protein
MAIQSNFPSIRPSLLLDFANSKRLDPRVTFTRASTATYYDGVTVSKAEENLFLRSAEFNEAVWSKDAATVTANAVNAPDGTATADAVVPTATSATHGLGQASLSFVNGLAYTMSTFVKPNGYNYLRLAFNPAAFASAGRAAVFDLTSTGSVSAVDSGVTAVITASTDGFFRVSITATANASASTNIAININDAFVSGTGATTYTGDGTSGVYVWGAQLEQRSAVTAYTATTTQAITNYVPRLLTAAAGVARFDHTPTTGASLGLLVEESRANLVTYSDDFANAAWNKNRSSITSNTIIAPDGTLTGDKIVEDTSVTLDHRVNRSITTTAASHAFSVYAKAGERQWIQLRNLTASYDAYFDLSNGAVGTVTAGATGSIVNVGNGWYRCVLVGTATAASNEFRITLSTGNGVVNYTGNGYSGAFIWGAQLEAGAFATSYIPTVASAVTRSADAASMTGTNFSSWYNASEGTLYADYVPNVPVGAGTLAKAIFDIHDGTANNRIRVFRPSADGIVQLSVTANGSQVVSNLLTSVVASGTTGRTAAAFKVNDFAVVTNAGTVGTDTSGALSVVDRMAIGNSQAGNSPWNGTIRKLAYYPSRLTNANLQAITG